MTARLAAIRLAAPAIVPAGALALGLGLGAYAASPAPAPTEHKGLKVTMLGALQPVTLKTTIGLEGYTLRLRAVGIAPGGQIARHSHEDRPGLVKVISGQWVEGRPEGERVFEAGAEDSIIEDENTVHWVFNRTDSFATGIVCDIAKAE